MKDGMYFKLRGKNNKKQVLLIHGWGHSSKSWDKVVDDLSDKYQIVTVDLLGHGNSESPSHKGKLLDFLTKKLFDLIKEQKWELDAIISHSMGGVIALNMIKNYSLSIESLMIIGTPYCGLPIWASTVGSMDKLVKFSLEGKTKLPPKFSRLLSRWGSALTVKDLSTIHEGLYLDMEKGNPEYMSRLFKELATNCFSLDKPLNIKSVIVARGEYDKLSSRDSLIKLARFLKGEYYQFKNVSHTVPIEAPDELKKVIFKLLD